MAKSRQNPREIILLRSDKTEKCWFWTGLKTWDGYGVMGIGRRQYRAHRISYEVFHGIQADGFSVCHRCDNPICVNPDHLFLGSPKDNTQDMIQKGRKFLMIDEQHPNTKITHQNRRLIISRRNNGEKLTEIANDYNVSFQTISAICLGARNYAATN
jgi:hypothetical protein